MQNPAVSSGCMLPEGFFLFDDKDISVPLFEQRSGNSLNRKDNHIR
jgi:hypothetical protein